VVLARRPGRQSGTGRCQKSAEAKVVGRRRQALAQWGASIIYLPPYSPDLNSIENFFSKLKALLRRAAERSFDGLVKAIASILDATSPQECSNYFDASGYVHT